MPPRPESPYRLLVEGSDDLHAIVHLMRRHGFDWDDRVSVRPFVEESGGVTELLEELPIVLKGTYSRVGVVLDANLSLSDRWAQLQARARRSGIELPDSPDPDGTVVQGRLPEYKVGIWLMPDNSSPGTLESFLLKLVPREDPIWSYADLTARTARERGGSCPEKDHPKSALHTWLAWQKEPGLPFGTALRAQVFHHESEEALRFVRWFRRLFG